MKHFVPRALVVKALLSLLHLRYLSPLGERKHIVVSPLGKAGLNSLANLSTKHCCACLATSPGAILYAKCLHTHEDHFIILF